LTRIKALAVIVVLSLNVGACASLSAVGTGISLATKSITNPVTQDELYAIEASIRIAVTALQAYKDACAAGSADKNCRLNVASVQPYTRQIPPLLIQLRGFVKNNDQINATVVYNQLSALYVNLKNAATSVGISMGA
jgi:hypothetical protein